MSQFCFCVTHLCLWQLQITYTLKHSSVLFKKMPRYFFWKYRTLLDTFKNEPATCVFVFIWVWNVKIEINWFDKTDSFYPSCKTGKLDTLSCLLEEFWWILYVHLFVCLFICQNLILQKLTLFNLWNKR